MPSLSDIIWIAQGRRNLSEVQLNLPLNVEPGDIPLRGMC
jgi:hypothetical protein